MLPCRRAEAFSEPPHGRLAHLTPFADSVCPTSIFPRCLQPTFTGLIKRPRPVYFMLARRRAEAFSEPPHGRLAHLTPFSDSVCPAESKTPKRSSHTLTGSARLGDPHA